MGLAKKVETAAAVALREHRTNNGTEVAEAPKQAESGTDAAIKRLSTAKTETVKAIEKVQYKQRDFDAEARGKTRCVQFEAALMSPAIAGMQFNTMEEYLKLVKQAADAGVAYTFGE